MKGWFLEEQQLLIDNIDTQIMNKKFYVFGVMCLFLWSCVSKSLSRQVPPTQEKKHTPLASQTKTALKEEERADVLSTSIPTRNLLTSTPETSFDLGELHPLSIENAQRAVELARWQERVAINCLAFSPQNGLIAFGNDEGWVKIIQLGASLSPNTIGNMVLSIKAHTKRVNALAFSKDGTLVATASDDYTAKTWHVADGSLARVFEGYEDGLPALAFSPDGKWLAVSSYDFSLNLWKVSEEGARRDFSTKNTFVRGLAFSPDSKLLATASNNWKEASYNVYIWQVFNGIIVRTLRGFSERVNGLTFSPDGNLLAVASGDEINPRQDKLIRLFDPKSGKTLQTLSGHTRVVSSIAFAPHNALLASASYDETLRLWSLTDGKQQASLTNHSGDIMDVAFSPDGKLLASSSRDGSLRLWGVRQ